MFNGFFSPSVEVGRKEKAPESCRPNIPWRLESLLLRMSVKPSVCYTIFHLLSAFGNKWNESYSWIPNTSSNGSKEFCAVFISTGFTQKMPKPEGLDSPDRVDGKIQLSLASCQCRHPSWKYFISENKNQFSGIEDNVVFTDIPFFFQHNSSMPLKGSVVRGKIAEVTPPHTHTPEINYELVSTLSAHC